MCLQSLQINSSFQILYSLLILFSNLTFLSYFLNLYNCYLCRNLLNSSKLFANTNLFGIHILFRQWTNLIICFNLYKKREGWCFVWRDIMHLNRIFTLNIFTKCLLLKEQALLSDCKFLKKKCKKNRRIKVDQFNTSICQLEKLNRKT
jgi:hypothetical protein